MGRPGAGARRAAPETSSRAADGLPDRALRARRRVARPAARLPPARDPPEPPPRLPFRADAAGPPELDAGHRVATAALPHRPAVDRAMERWFFSPRRHVPRAAARDDAARLLGPRALERAARERGAVSHGGAAAAAAGGRARRELGPHRREGRHLAALRPLRRPEPRDGGRPAPLPRDRAGARARHRVAADRSVPPLAAARAAYDAARCGATGSTLGARSSLVAGNTPSNTPYEGRFVERLVEWWAQAPEDRPAASLPAAPARQHAGGSASRPPRGTRASSCRRRATADLDDLATLLQHADVVVCNAGTILLDALVGDRPAVCVLYDEGAPPGESWAAKNVVGEHYQELAASGAFYRAERFEEVVVGDRARARAAGRARRATAPGGRAGGGRRGRPRGRARGRRGGEHVRGPRTVKVVMTLLARNEADVVDAQIAFHLHAGVDFVIATDNASTDDTAAIFERYERAGRLRLLREPGDDMRQAEWVTRMARLAATEHDADWVIHSDADEFWWPRGGTLEDVLATVPARYGVVRGCWRHFLPRPDDGSFFAERMTVRLAVPAHPGAKETIFHAHQKIAHRAHPAVEIEAREPQRRGAGPPSPARLASPRGSALLVPVGRPGRAQGPPRRVAPQPRPTVRADPAPDPARGGAARRPDPCLLRRRTRSTTRRSPAGSRTARSRSTPAFATCCVRCATRTGASSCPATGRRSRSPGRARSRTRHTPRRRPSSSRSTASSAPSSACVRSSERLGALERGALRSARRLARR